MYSIPSFHTLSPPSQDDCGAKKKPEHAGFRFLEKRLDALLDADVSESMC